ncbi:Na+/H+ antiporter NhaC family protein [Pseudoflavonifractor phocaeensis]|uniref:Na+/H+ antiporter NhaC family protein n=1 Tax=Pseudoflavonifractor phocaeensis TaxID=1870988 RepID=UPI001F31BB5D|nr:Na+/H+ antiporter NhaC family protein [Pseudoflavonifractor phocaeensis]
MRARRSWPVRAILVLMMVLALATTAFAADPTEESGTKMIECPDCGAVGVVLSEDCEAVPCGTCEGTGYIQSPSQFYNTAMSLLPPVIAIALALITKEVYSSLFIGILVGGLLYSNFSFEGTILHVFSDGIVASLSDSYNVGILIFLVILGTMVCLMNKAGGSAAFGRWAQKNIKTRAGAQLASIVLGCLIFIDDYFNCLTVGSVMRPITDKHNVSRAKLAYLIDATAAPICIIAPISSWAAAVAGFAEEGQGLNLFIRAIPYNFYALLTIVMMIGLVVMNVDFGPMGKFEKNAQEKGDLFSGSNPYAMLDEEIDESKGTVMDLVLPIVVLVICCVVGMIYSGGFFSGESFIDAFSNSDASVGLMLGSAFGLVFAFLYYFVRKSMTFKEMMGCIPEGFKAMVPAILILTFAWSLKGMTDSLGAKYFVRDFVRTSATGVQMLLPVIVFVIGCLLAFATGTSWGTFGILIPIVQNVFSMDNPLAIICISACMAGAVCGDHCSPISDTTIMASAGAQCDHVNHVSTQLPYAISCAVISGLSYIVAGLLASSGLPGILALPVGVVLTLGFLFYMKKRQNA